jgi:hypothetical protein
MVVWQLGEWRKKRSVEQLQRVAVFSPDAKNHRGHSRRTLVKVAQDALSKIDGNEG